MSLQAILPQNTDIIVATNEEYKAFVQRCLDMFDEKHKQQVANEYAFLDEYTDEKYECMIKRCDDEIIKIRSMTYEQLSEYCECTIEDDYDYRIHSEGAVKTYEGERDRLQRDYDRKKQYQENRASKCEQLSHYPRTPDQLAKCELDNLKHEIINLRDSIRREFFNIMSNKIIELINESINADKTINSVFNTNVSKKALDIIDRFIDQADIMIRQMLVQLSFRINTFNDIVIAKNDIESSVNQFIAEGISYPIREYINKLVDSFSNQPLDNAVAVKLYCQQMIKDINNNMIVDLPRILNESVIESKKEFDFKMSKYTKHHTQMITAEDVGNDYEVVVDEVVEVVPTIDSFISTLPQTINSNDLVIAYNNFFHATLDIKQIIAIRELKPHLKNCGRKTVNKKKITVYEIIE